MYQFVLSLIIISSLEMKKINKLILLALIILFHEFHSKIKSHNSNMWNLSPVAIRARRSGKLISLTVEVRKEKKVKPQ